MRRLSRAGSGMSGNAPDRACQDLSVTFNELPGELSFDLRDHDVRIERGEWVYFVRGVKSVESLAGDMLAGATGPVEAVLGFFMVEVLDVWWRRKKAWKVGVLRVKGSRWGPSGRIKVLHKEVLTAGVEPNARIAQLAEEVLSGRFDSV